MVIVFYSYIFLKINIKIDQDKSVVFSSQCGYLVRIVSCLRHRTSSKSSGNSLPKVSGKLKTSKPEISAIIAQNMNGIFSPKTD